MVLVLFGEARGRCPIRFGVVVGPCGLGGGPCGLGGGGVR